MTLPPDVTDRTHWDPIRAGALLAEATREANRPAPRLLASDWARAFRDGDRSAYEDAQRRLLERLNLLAVAAVLTDGSHLDAVIDALVLLCEASTWCWAPHDRHARARGEVVPDPDDPYLDLGAAQVASALAWADHALGPHLDSRAPGLRRRLRRETDRRVLTPFENVRDWPWITMGNNWNPWIHGAVLECALLLCDDEPRRDRLVRLAADGLQLYADALPPDGGVDEGVSYWWQGPCRLLEALDLLGRTDVPPALLTYPQRMHLGGDWYVNVGDAHARLPPDQPWHVLHRWAVRLGLDDTAAYAAGRAVHPRVGLGRALAALSEPGRRVTGEPWLARQSWLPDVQVLVAREQPGTSAGLAVAVKAGHNGEHHNHLDVGTYWIALDGRPLVVDAGMPTYTAATFGPRRYAEWPFQSGWHNVPEPGGPQLPGRDHAAHRVAVRPGGLRADLAPAYGGQVERWDRDVRLEAGRITVTEDWSGLHGNALLRHLLSGDVEHGDGWATVAADGRALRLTWDPAAAAATIERRPLDDAKLRRAWGEHLTRLTLTLTAPAPAGRFTATWMALEQVTTAP